MNKFQILCVTMNQKDFSKVKEMNIHDNIIYANQADDTIYEEKPYDTFMAQMITTRTRGVGNNRNIAFMYANADICLLADDDVTYVDGLQEIVVTEFNKYPEADIIIFHLNTTNEYRKQIRYKKTRKHYPWQRMPWGGGRIAFRLDSVKKANIWFTTLFGGGAIFSSGEDSMWLNEAKKKGLKFYVSDKTIGEVSFGESTWFTGYDNRFFFSKGAYYQSVHSKTIWIWIIYFAIRTSRLTKIKFIDRIRQMQKGRNGYLLLRSFVDFENDKIN